MSNVDKKVAPILDLSKLLLCTLPILSLTSCIIISTPPRNNFIIQTPARSDGSAPIPYPSQGNFPLPTDYIPISQISIPSQFTVIPIDISNFDKEANKCVPTLHVSAQSIQQTSNNLNKANSTTVFSHLSSANRFVIHQGNAVCIPFSAAKYPIFPAEMINDTANPKGVSPDIIEGWNKKIAELIATKGFAKVAYVFSNSHGNANIVKYWTAQNDTTLHYSSNFQVAGSWENDNYDAKFTDNDLNSFSEVKRSGLSQKTPLAKIP